jgi:hypothetical protein
MCTQNTANESTKTNKAAGQCKLQTSNAQTNSAPTTAHNNQSINQTIKQQQQIRSTSN